MQQIADWLKKLGMAEYAQRFADNDIDIFVRRHWDLAPASTEADAGDRRN